MSVMTTVSWFDNMTTNEEFGFNPLEFRGSYSATSNMKLVHWPLTDVSGGGLLHLVQ